MNRITQATAVKAALKKLENELPNYTINELRIVVALERVVARLERHAELPRHLVFKGGFVLLKTINTSRFTRDIDALALDISRENIVNMVQQALKVDLHDGFWFGDVEVEDLKNQGPYGGYRFSCAFQIGDPPKEKAKIKKLSRLHLDIGFGDALEEVPPKTMMPAMIAADKPVSWSIYPLEYIFAEKLEALISRGAGSSRAKDIYDMPLIFPSCDPKTLAEAIVSTFKIRQTAIPSSFHKTAQATDATSLSDSWGALDLPQESPIKFDRCWREFINCLAVVDHAMLGKADLRPKRHR